MGHDDKQGGKPAAGSRLDRVRQILDRAVADTAYRDEERFWRLPLAALLEHSLYGVRLIAPPRPAGGSCCHKAAAGPGRGDESGLVRGLRGQAPFDGTRFPRLPWGGQPVAEADIQFIAGWIDDGCPDDRMLADYALPPEAGEPGPVQIEQQETTASPSVQAQVFEVYGGDVNTWRQAGGGLKQRMNIDCLNPAQLERLRYAFREMYALNKWPEDARSYNNLALIHQNHCQHGWERFLTWHRVYLYEFELAMQEHAPEVTMPYWDWTMAHYHPGKPETGWIIPRALQCFLTEDSLPVLARHGIPVAGLAPLVGLHYASQQRFFNAVGQAIGARYTVGEYRERFIDALLDANPLWYPLRYPAEFGSGTMNTVIHYHYPTADDMRQILSLRTFRDFGGGGDYNDAFGFLDQNPHNTMHIWTGGMNPQYGAQPAVPDDRNKGVQVAGRRFHKRSDLYSQPQFGDMFSNLTASYDPVFWPIHANIDRTWWEWQQDHPDAAPADLDAVLTPWSYTARDTLDASRFGYEYVRGSYLVPVGLASAVGRFVSQPIAVAEPVRAAFGQAEVRLHRVPQLPRSCFVRVFLNLPDANAETPLDHPNYAGYLAIFGHGPCYGGPGHCDIPAARKEYDLRPRSHNTPRNHRVDVSAAARRLLDGGAESLQITLVVIGADYREEKELLRLEGVSLAFLD
ncbi:tyrosinase family protein [Chitinimonas koreensis]|uniref:tyrosinase family protein n=1 Tax=Chitinimonas koreensis TaxID=356302 RepID=UPI0004299951|nr:tyrosinase family protein [Chitinimonas koreensis]QNM98541.1 tyrosinase family protein [Chitinimonas koreensis]